MSEFSEEAQREKEFWEENGRPNTNEEMEWYRLWYKFLQLSDEKKIKRREEVANDWGDVSGNFDDWWPTHSYLFHQLKHFTIEELITDHDFQDYKDDGSMPDDPGAIILAFNPYESKAVLRAAFEDILTKYHKGTAGRPKFEDWGDVYELKCRPDTEMLNKILAVYEVYAADRKKPEEEQMTLWEIEEEVSKTIPLIDKTSTKATYLWITKDADANIIESRRRSQHTTVSKYLKYADQILENVALGNFPVYDQS